jgi:hypothetical protein
MKKHIFLASRTMQVLQYHKKKDTVGFWLINTFYDFVLNKHNGDDSPQSYSCNNFSVYYPDVYLQLNMFRAFSAHH